MSEGAETVNTVMQPAGRSLLAAINVADRAMGDVVRMLRALGDERWKAMSRLQSDFVAPLHNELTEAVEKDTRPSEVRIAEEVQNAARVPFRYMSPEAKAILHANWRNVEWYSRYQLKWVVATADPRQWKDEAYRLAPCPAAGAV